MKSQYRPASKSLLLLAHMLIAIPLFALAGCGSTRFYLKSASLRDGDPCAEIRYGDNMDDVSGNITRIYTSTAAGERREDPIIDKDSVGTNAGKLAFSLTPLGMMMDAMDTTELAVLVPGGRVELLVEMKGARRVPKETSEGRKEEVTIMSTWSYKFPVELEAGGLYTMAYFGRLVVRDENGSIVGQSTDDALMEVSEFNEKAYLLSKADRDVVEKGRVRAEELGAKIIPAYSESDDMVVVLSGSLDLGQVVSGLDHWIPLDRMLVNVGRNPVVIDGIGLRQGEYILHRSGQYIKEALPE